MRGFITSILTAIAITSLHAEPNTPIRPKLIVGLTVDQLNTELIEAYWSLYGEKGFKKLWKEGQVYKQTDFPLTAIDRSSATATINTGTTPSVHGIIANEWLDLSTMQPQSCVYDANFMGNYTTLFSSPKSLLSSTITDQLKIASQGKSIVYSIAPEADMAILSAGHSADAALWFNQESGLWCGTTYYKDFPWWASKHNEINGLPYREEELDWSPGLDTDRYITSYNGRKKTFKYNLLTPRDVRYQRVTKSPLINKEVILLAKEVLDKSDIGEDDSPDFLQLSLYGGIEFGTNEAFSLESQDTYVRLDKNIEDLLQAIDSKIGLRNTLFILTSTGYNDNYPASTLESHQVPTGEFYLNRCAALLNMYLMATYGEGQYIEAYHDLQIYLNHDLLENKELDIVEIQEKSALFLSQFSGVNEVYYANDLLLGSWNPQKGLRRNSFHKKRSGDLLLEIMPGWQIVNKDDSRTTVNYSAVQAPTVFLGEGFKPAIIATPIEVEAIAPTIAKTIRIRAPNASKATAIKINK